MSANHAFCDGSLMLPHMRPARWKAPLGRFDHFCFCAVFEKSNWTVPFSAAFSVPRKALAAATMLGTGVAAAATVVEGVAVGAVVALAAPVVLVAPSDVLE